MLKTSGHGSIRKVKGGAVGVLALSTLFVGIATASADEATTPNQPTVEVSAKPTAEDAPAPVKSEDTAAATTTEKVATPEANKEA